MGPEVRSQVDRATPRSDASQLQVQARGLLTTVHMRILTNRVCRLDDIGPSQHISIKRDKVHLLVRRALRLMVPPDILLQTTTTTKCISISAWDFEPDRPNTVSTLVNLLVAPVVDSSL